MLRADLDRLRQVRPNRSIPVLWIESLLFNNGFLAVVLYRIAHWFKARRIPMMGPLFGRIQTLLTGVEIAPGAEIGAGLMISHGQGIVIGQWVRIGKNATLMQQVTLGAPSIGRLEQMPQVGNDVFIGAGARIIGGITIGDGAKIGTNAVVVRDVPAGGRAAAPTAEIAEASIRTGPRSEQAPDQNGK